MTRDEILNMPAGREMDAQVGYIVYPDAKKHGFIVCPKYSTDIKDAWEVLEKLNLTDFTIEKAGAHYCVNLTIESACAETAPLAICRAALLAAEAV